MSKGSLLCMGCHNARKVIQPDREICPGCGGKQAKENWEGSHEGIVRTRHLVRDP